MLKFNDGMQFNTEQELKIERRSDGLYVVGDGMLIPVENVQEARELIADLTAIGKGDEDMI